MSFIIADTSIWLDFLGPGDAIMHDMLRAGKVLMHTAVIAEIALGNLRNRERVLYHLAEMRRAYHATDQEVLALIEAKALCGSGVGFADTHLIGSTLLTPHCKLWTRDKRLDAVSQKLGIAYQPAH